MIIYRCDGCKATFDHPETEEECKHAEGGCALLVEDGWKKAWVKVFLDAPIGQQDRHILSQGGWVCPACHATNVPEDESVICPKCKAKVGEPCHRHRADYRGTHYSRRKLLGLPPGNRS